MYIDIRTRGFPITVALRDHAVRRLRFALSRMGDGILSVSVTLGDINGPRGGTDKTCCVRIETNCLPASRTALPENARSFSPISIWGCLSELRAGFAMSGAAATCSNWCAKFRWSACCWRRTPLT